MSDLIQFQEHGFQTPAGVDWYRGSACIVTGANRRRILDRDSIEPRPDGWAYQTRHISDGLDVCDRTEASIEPRGDFETGQKSVTTTVRAVVDSALRERFDMDRLRRALGEETRDQ